MNYIDQYPSGKTYVACGEPHPTGREACSRPADHTHGHHMNKMGNAWDVGAVSGPVIRATPCGMPLLVCHLPSGHGGRHEP